MLNKLRIFKRLAKVEFDVRTYYHNLYEILRHQGIISSYPESETNYRKLSKDFHRLLEHLGLEVCDGGEIKKKGKNR